MATMPLLRLWRLRLTVTVCLISCAAVPSQTGDQQACSSTSTFSLTTNATHDQHEHEQHDRLDVHELGAGADRGPTQHGQHHRKRQKQCHIPDDCLTKMASVVDDIRSCMTYGQQTPRTKKTRGRCTSRSRAPDGACRVSGDARGRNPPRHHPAYPGQPWGRNRDTLPTGLNRIVDGSHNVSTRPTSCAKAFVMMSSWKRCSREHRGSPGRDGGDYPNGAREVQRPWRKQ